jgi:hypothetical protein
MGYKELTAALFAVSDYAQDFALAGMSKDGITYNLGLEDVQDGIHNRGISFDIFDTIV